MARARSRAGLAICHPAVARLCGRSWSWRGSGAAACDRRLNCTARSAPSRMASSAADNVTATW